MFDIHYRNFIIKLKHFPPSEEWLVTVRSGRNQTIASKWFSVQSQGEQWAKGIIDGLVEEE
jgi:hypothetical protein